MPQAAEKTHDQPYDPAKDPARKEIIRCMVHHANAAPENKEMPIIVNDMGSPNGKRIIQPGKPTDLTRAQVNVLRDSVEEHNFPIPFESGIYEVGNPRKAAEGLYPGHQINVDRATGQVFAWKRVPNYIVEIA